MVPSLFLGVHLCVQASVGFGNLNHIDGARAVESNLT